MRPLFIILLSFAAPALNAQSTNRGVQLFLSSDWARAKTEFTAVIQKNDRDARAHYYLARLALLEDDPDAAVEHSERAVKLDDKVSDYHLWYGKAISQQAIRASMLERPFLVGHAKSEMERAVALDARNIDARDALADFYSMAPAAMGGGADRAREQADAIARLNAMRGHFALGRLATRANDGATVEREMNAAIAAAPDTLRIYSALANWYANQKQWPQAFATIDRYIKRRPNDPHGPNAVGRIAALSGQQLERGEQGIRAFVAKPPKDVSPTLLSLSYLRLGQVLQQEGKSAEARVSFEQAVKIDPRNEDAKKEIK
jgi:tetratricopeptide (TPR) repeat protein